MINSKKKELSFRLTFIIFFLFSISILIFLSLVTYNINDNSFFKYDSSLEKTSNILGYFG